MHLTEGSVVANLAPHQAGVWTAQLVAPSSASQQGVVALELRGELDVDAFRAALDALALRHAALRTTFHKADALHPAPHQVVHRRFEVVFELISALGWSDERLRERVCTDARIPIDLTKGPFRVSAYACGPQRHVVAFATHHIGLDSVSVELYLRDIPRLYEAALRHELLLLPEVPVDYLGFVKGYDDYLKSPPAEVSMSYWAERLADAPMALELPLDRPRPPLRAGRGAYHVIDLPPELVKGLRGLGKSLNRTLLAAFQILLFRYSGQADMVTGMPADLRPSPEYMDVMGHFVNMLVLRFDLSNDPTVKELLGQIQGVVSDAVKHRHTPLTHLIEKLRPKRDPSTTPFFQVAMGLQRMSRLPQFSAYVIPEATWTAKLGPFEARPYAVIAHEGQYDFELIGAELDSRIWLAFKYNVELLDRATAVRMADNFKVLAAAMVTSPDARISSLAVMTDRERSTVLVDWNQTSEPFPREQCIHDLVEAAAQRNPKALAVTWKEVSLSYGDLTLRATAIARELRSNGVARNDRVALVLDRTHHAIVGMLGVLKSGGAYLPLDPSLPRDRIATILRDAGVRVAITTAAQRSSIAALVAHVIVIDEVKEPARDASRALTHVNVPSDIAYVIYTSGSTGEPKGVLLQHLGLVSNVTWTKRKFGIGAGTRVAQVIALAFDGSILEIWPALAAGGSLHLVDDETRLSPPHLVDWMRRLAIEYAVLPTPLAEMCLELAPDLPALRILLAGGDKLHRPKRQPSFRLFNGYGPTESTVITTFAEVTAGRDDELPPIGRPVANTRVYLLDRHDQPVPIGSRGELCIGGVTIARGYLNRPELEAKKFIADSLSTEGGRLYKTGDLARYRADGTLDFAGRIDNQVKIRGFRIELGEIESVLSRHPAVEECFMTVCELTGGQHLVAYVVGQPEKLRRRELRAFLAEHLPEYMLPTVVVVLDALPLTSTGKIDHAALPPPSMTLEEPLVPPDTTTEERLVRLWRDELRLGEIGVLDDFFERGGDSLMAMRLVAAIETEFGCEFLVHDILRKTTVRDQARWIDSGATGGRDDPAIVTLRDGDLPALVFAHTILGSVVPYRPLATAIGDTRAVLGVAAPAQPIAEDLDTIAQTYARSLLGRGASERYLLAGWSFGGVLALALAHHLREADRQVPLVVLIDAPHPSALSFPDNEAELVERFFSFFLGGQHGAAPPVGYVDKTAADPLAHALSELQAQTLIPRDLTLAHISTMYRSFRSHAVALQSHQPKTWDGEVLFVKATRDVGLAAWGASMQSAASLDRWRSVCTRIEVQEIDANHFTLLSAPHVGRLAARITESSRRVLSR